jgi:hypothetical protein
MDRPRRRPVPAPFRVNVDVAAAKRGCLTCEAFLHSAPLSARLRRAGPSGPWPRSDAEARAHGLLRNAACVSDQARAGRERGQLGDSGAAAYRALTGGSPPGGASARSARPHPQAGSPSRNVHSMTATARTGQARPPRAGHSPAAQRSQSRSYVLATLRALHLDSDIPRQDPAPIRRTREDRGS